MSYTGFLSASVSFLNNMTVRKYWFFILFPVALWQVIALVTGSYWIPWMVFLYSVLTGPIILLPLFGLPRLFDILFPFWGYGAGRWLADNPIYTSLYLAIYAYVFFISYKRIRFSGLTYFLLPLIPYVSVVSIFVVGVISADSAISRKIKETIKSFSGFSGEKVAEKYEKYGFFSSVSPYFSFRRKVGLIEYWVVLPMSSLFIYIALYAAETSFNVVISVLFVSIPFAIIFLVLSASTIIGRMRDVGWSLWMFVFMFIPYYNLALISVLSVLPGRKGGGIMNIIRGDDFISSEK